MFTRLPSSPAAPKIDLPLLTSDCEGQEEGLGASTPSLSAMAWRVLGPMIPSAVVPTLVYISFMICKSGFIFVINIEVVAVGEAVQRLQA